MRRLFFLMLCWGISLSWSASADPIWSQATGGMKWRTLQQGNGEALQAGDIAVVHYRGWVQKGGKPSADPFDESYSRQEPLRFPLGAGEVIRGWDLGLVGMRVGEQRELLVPPTLGYGDQDLGVIPPSSWLLFQVELLEREAGLTPDDFFDASAITWKEITPGVEISDIRLGKGTPSRDGDQLLLHYTGWLPGGTRFASSKTTAKPVQTLLGAGLAIPGWEIGLKEMSSGGIRLMRIQPYMGYGAQAGPKLPPHSTLLFKVELLEREGGEESEHFDLFPDLSTLSWKSGAQGLNYVVVNGGSGAPLSKAGDKVTVHYTGWLSDGTRFDSSRSRGEPFLFSLGAAQVISGWDLGVVGMAVGEKRLLKVPSALGYGAKGAGAIPPNAELIFAVELLSIE